MDSRDGSPLSGSALSRREHAEIFGALFDEAADPIVVVDQDGRIVLANPAIEALLGWSATRLLGESVETLVPERFEGHPRQRARFVCEAEPRPMGRGLELFARHADGHEIPVDISLIPLVVGDRCLVACAIRDLRGRSYGDEILRVKATALRSAANGIVITDAEGIITWVNPAACAITGYSSDELVGRHTRMLKSGQHGPEFYAVLWNTVTSGRTWSGTIVNRRKDGSLYHEEQTIAPVVGEGGAVSHFIAIKQDVTEQRKTQEALMLAHEELAARLAEIERLNLKLQDQASRDPLTQLYNRRYLEEAIERDVARAVRVGKPLAIAVVDIDEFKEVNDTHGHEVGDRVLQHLANVLLSLARSSDLVCRLGGDEFVVAMPDTDAQSALSAGMRWRDSFSEETVAVEGGTTLRTTISVGVAELRPGEDTVSATLIRADRALYGAKEAGRNRVVSAEDAARPESPKG